MCVYKLKPFNVFFITRTLLLHTQICWIVSSKKLLYTYLKTGNAVSVKLLVCYRYYRPIPNRLVDAFDRQNCPIRRRPSYAIAPLRYSIQSLD